MLKRWTAFTRFLDDGRICLSNNAAERALRGIALGRKAWLFAGSERGGERAGDHVHIDPDCPRRRARQDCRSPNHQSCRAPPLELEEVPGHCAAYRRCRLTRGAHRRVTIMLPFGHLILLGAPRCKLLYAGSISIF
jgi:hypothetical protein